MFAGGVPSLPGTGADFGVASIYDLLVVVRTVTLGHPDQLIADHPTSGDRAGIPRLADLLPDPAVDDLSGLAGRLVDQAEVDPRGLDHVGGQLPRGQAAALERVHERLGRTNQQRRRLDGAR